MLSLHTQLFSLARITGNVVANINDDINNRLEFPFFLMAFARTLYRPVTVESLVFFTMGLFFHQNRVLKFQIHS